MYLPSSDFVATFGDCDLYVEGHDWVLKRGSLAFDTDSLKNGKTLSWLPLLEQDYADFQESLVRGLAHLGPEESALRLTAFPTQDLILLGLASPSAYWVDLALRWVGKMGTWPALLPTLHALSLDLYLPQSTRRAAKRLYYTGKL
ncbi:hypothetical protein [Hymenobacter negativus]|uniref:Uncharacterized protein n=1 Tax=Hymenobacter negativus TaxID=2795026 RepID=A0ABS0QBX3_9BACT|nr:hypothetical protein [Hymenobacter negativus]MBH8560194.1 hypothetical protein [Hymenobacter negativus]